jgi:hypothetical protein
MTFNVRVAGATDGTVIVSTADAPERDRNCMPCRNTIDL